MRPGGATSPAFVFLVSVTAARELSVIVEIECIANPLGTPTNPYEHVEAAIRVIEHSGLHYEVSALGTTLEGDPDDLWPLLRRVHEACLESGAASLLTVIKVEQARRDLPQPTMAGLTGKFRQQP